MTDKSWRHIAQATAAIAGRATWQTGVFGVCGGEGCISGVYGAGSMIGGVI